MIETHEIEAFLVETAKLLDAEYLQRDENGNWDMAFPEREWFEIILDAERHVLTITRELEAPHEEKRANLHTLALRYNYMWDQTGGGRLSLEPAKDALVYSIDIALSLCTAEYLSKIISNMRITTTAWLDMARDDPTTNIFDQMNTEGWIKM